MNDMSTSEVLINTGTSVTSSSGGGSEPDSDTWARLGRAAVPTRAFEHLCRYNTRAGMDRRTSVFHSTEAPAVCIPKYLERLVRLTDCGELGILIGLCLAGRYAAMRSAPPSVLCAHRLLVACVLVGTKAHIDHYRSNRTFARAGGLELAELNELEVALLVGLEHRLTVTNEELAHMCSTASRAACMGLSLGAGGYDSAMVAEQAFLKRAAGLPTGYNPRPPVMPRPPPMPPASASTTPRARGRITTFDSCSSITSPIRDRSFALASHSTESSPQEVSVAGPAMNVARAARLGASKLSESCIIIGARRNSDGSLATTALASPTESDRGCSSPIAALPRPGGKRLQFPPSPFALGE